jgi:hypothetical protein
MCICEGLPTLAASYGSKAVQIHSSSICVQHKSQMDTSLWHQLLRDLYTPLFEGRLLPEPIHNPVTMKLILKPLIVRTDSAPGRLSKEADSLQFHKQMAALGVHFFLSLLNATVFTAEMDQLFEKFKLACSKCALSDASRKMQQRMTVRVENMNKVVCLLDGSDNNDEADPIVDNGLSKHWKLNICNVSFF